MGVLIRCFPDPWFETIALFIGRPFARVYRACKRVFSRMGSKIRRNRSRSERNASDTSDGSVVPAIVVQGDESKASTVVGSPFMSSASPSPVIGAVDLEKGSR